MLGYILAVSAGCCAGFVVAGMAASMKVGGYDERIAELEKLLHAQNALMGELAKSLHVILGSLDNRVSNSVAVEEISNARDMLARCNALALDIEQKDRRDLRLPEMASGKK